MREVRTFPSRRLAYCAITSLTALTMFLLLLMTLLWPYQPALAQSALNFPPTGSTLHNSVVDFGGACVVLPGFADQPELANTIVSSANGGELRLSATLEDYFDGDEIDASRWITGFSNEEYPAQVPLIGSGVLTLYGSFLRSVQVFSDTTPVRFLEASAQFASDRTPSDADLGFYRAVTPTLQAEDPESSGRLFISKPNHGGIDRLMYVRSRDGFVEPAVDSRVNNWGGNIEDERVALAQYLTYRIEWDEAETWYLINGSPITVVDGDHPMPHTGVSTRTTYAFLYNQDPLDPANPDWDDTSPLLVDWIRAGVYPASGVYTSCVQDAGQVVNWSQATVTATLPANTGAVLATRTSVDGVSWSAWQDVSGSVLGGAVSLAPISPSGRYLQYRLTLLSDDPLQSPEVDALNFSYFAPASIVVAPAAITLNPNATQQFAAEVRDANNTVVSSIPVTWSVTAGGGGIDSSGLFTAGIATGIFTDTVLVTTVNDISGRATVAVFWSPVADAGGPYAGFEGQPVNLSASESSEPNGGVLLYAWDLNDNGQYNDAFIAEPSYTWSNNGVYTVSVLVTGSGGLTDTATATVVIANVAPQIDEVITNSPVRRGQPLTVTVNASDTPDDTLYYSFDWTSNGVFDIVNSLSNTAVANYTATGQYTVTVQVADNDGGEATATTEITVEPQNLSASASNDGPVRRGQSVTVSVSATQELTDTLSYGFDFDNDGSYEVTQPTPTAVVSYMTTGAKTVGVRVTDGNGGVATATTEITVEPQNLSASASNDGPVRRGQSVTVSVSATQELTDTLSYGFDFDGDGIFEVVHAANSAAAGFASTGVKIVGFGVTDGNGAIVTGTTSVVVTPQILSVSAVSNDGPVLIDQPVTVIVTATQQLSDPLTYSFDWNDDGVYDVLDQAANSAVTSYAAVGEKTVRVRVRDADGGEATGATTVSVNAQVIQITAVNSDAPKRRGQAVTVSVTAAQQLNDTLYYSFDWNNDGVYEVLDQVSNTASTIFASVGEKIVRVRVRDSQDNQAAATKTLSIVPQSLSATATSNSPVRRGQEATITVNATQELSDILTYAFDFDGNGIDDLITTSNSAVISYTTTGVKEANVRVTDANGAAVMASTAVQVTPQNLAIAAVTNTGPVEIGDLVLVTVDAIQELEDVLLYSFDWDSDGIYDVVDQPFNSASTSYTSVGNKLVGVRVIDGNGSEATGVTIVQVDEVTGGGVSEYLFLPIVSR